MMRRLLFLGFFLGLFNVDGLAQVYVTLSVPGAANPQTIADHVGGVALDMIQADESNTKQILMSLPFVPDHFPDNDIVWSEVLPGATLPPVSHPRFLSVPQSSASDSTSWLGSQPSFQLINLPNALTFSKGRGAVVAVIEMPVDYSHPVLQGHLTSGYDFVMGVPSGGVRASLNDSSASYLDDSSASYLDQATVTYLNDSSASYLDDSSASYLDGRNSGCAWHGTATASEIAAVAPEAMIMPLSVFKPDCSANVFTIAQAIRYAARNGAQVINISSSTPTYSRVLCSAVEFARARGAVVIASAGNNNTPLPQYPGACDGALAIAATNLLDQKASFSNYGDIYVAAPGVNIVVAVPANLFGIVNGTSFSAPIVAGAAALAFSEGLVPTVVESKIASGTVNIDIPNPLFVGLLGHGRTDLSEVANPTLR